MKPSLLVQLHYTESERPALTAEVGSSTWLTWPNGPTGSVDPTALVQRVQEGVRTLVGPPLRELMANLPSASNQMPTPAQATTERPSGPIRQLPLD